MATSNYLGTFLSSLENFHNTALQQQQLEKQNALADRQQTLAEQELNARQQASLGDQLANGATPVDDSGNTSVPSVKPQVRYQPQQPSSTYTPPSGDTSPLQSSLATAPMSNPGATLWPGNNVTPNPDAAATLAPQQNDATAPDTGTLQSNSVSPLQYSLASGGTANLPADPAMTYKVAGKTLQAPGLQEQLARQDALEQAKNRIGKIRVTQQMSDATEGVIPADAYIDPSHAAIIYNTIKANAAAEKKEPSSPKLEAPDKLAIETAAATLAQKNGIKLDPSKSAFEQIPVTLRSQALGIAKEYNADPELRANRQAMTQSALATAALTRSFTGSKMDELNQKKQEAIAAGAQLNPKGKQALESIEPVMTQIDQLRQGLEQKDPNDPKGSRYKDNNSPTAFLFPMLKYKAGIKTPEGQLGSQISDMSLNAIQAVGPFASKSRNYQWIKDIKQHAPQLGGLTPDSPQMIHAKLGTIQRNFLRMNAATHKYETVKTNGNPPNPVLPEDKAQLYYNLALDGRDPKSAPDAPAKAMQMATEDGWQVPTTQPQ